MAKKKEVLSLLMSVNRSDIDEPGRAILGSLIEHTQSRGNVEGLADRSDSQKLGLAYA